MLPIFKIPALLFAIGSIVKVIPLGEYISDLVKMLYDHCNVFQGMAILLTISLCFVFILSVVFDKD
jgi:hypothetical protein